MSADDRGWFAESVRMMSRAQSIAALYRLYMQEEDIGLHQLAQRLNGAFRKRGQKPRIWHYPNSLWGAI